MLTDNRVAGDSLTLSASGLLADKNVGNAKTVTVSGLALTGADAANYSARLANATTRADIAARDLNVTAVVTDRAFDGSAKATVVLTDDRASGDQLTLSSAAAGFADATIGQGKVVSVTGIGVTGADAANYRLLQTSLATSGAITVGNSSESTVPRAPVVLPTAAAPTRVPSPLVLTTGDAATGYVAAPANGMLRTADAEISVTLVRESTRSDRGNVAVSVPAQILGKGQGFSFPLPASVGEALAVGGASAQVTASGGAPLPAWLHYTSASQTFEASADAAGKLPYTLTITVDGRSWELVISAGAN